ncbi:MAG: PaaI family thioesterase [Oleiphilaceae bacterium]|nr:PaaI family thioesterase [Oleiphilaceae bacterium]
MGLDAGEVQALIREWVPMAEDIDLQVVAIGDGTARIRIPFDARNLRPGGSVSGPVIMAAGDTAMYAAILGSLGKVAMAVTSNLNINFMQRPAQVALLADAQILKLGKRIAFCEVGIRSEGSEELVAHVTGSYSLPPEK